MRDYLAEEFNKLGKTKTDVTKVDRAMGKLYKEAERVKLVLSANTECYAQVENLLEDIDFKLLVTRDNLLKLYEDYLVPERITRPVIKGTEISRLVSISGVDNLKLSKQKLLFQYIFQSF